VLAPDISGRGVDFSERGQPGQRAGARSLLGSSDLNRALVEFGQFVNRVIDSLRAYIQSTIAATGSKIEPVVKSLLFSFPEPAGTEELFCLTLEKSPA
jgi:hypothetical protein